MKSLLRYRTKGFLCIGLLCATCTSRGADQTWTGNTSQNWTTGGNWSGSAQPGASDHAFFGSTVGKGSPIINSSSQIGEVVFNSGAASFTFTSSSPRLTINGITVGLVVFGIVNNNNSVETMNSGVNVASAQTWQTAAGDLSFGGAVSTTVNSTDHDLTLDGSFTTSISGQITGGGKLTKTGSGTAVLSNSANTFSGGLDINGGVVRIDATGAISTGGARNINSGGTLEISSGITVAQTLKLNDGGTLRGADTAQEVGKITVATGSTVTLATKNSSDVFTIGDGSNDLSGGDTSTTINVSGPGKIALGFSNNNKNTWGLNSGTLQVSADNQLGDAANGFNFAGGTLAANGTFSIGSARTLQFGTSGSGSIEVTSGNTLTAGTAHQLQGSGTLTKTGDGTFAITADNSNPGGFTGTIVVQGGTLAANGSKALGDVSAITLKTGGTLAFGAANPVNSQPTVEFAGGILSPQNRSEILGALSLTASSTIQLDKTASTSSTLRFGNASWTAGTLTIKDWSGTAGSGGGSDNDAVFITTILSPSDPFFAHVQFDGYPLGALQLGTGELVPAFAAVPESTTALAGFLIVGLFGWTERRRLRVLFTE